MIVYIVGVGAQNTDTLQKGFPDLYESIYRSHSSLCAIRFDVYGIFVGLSQNFREICSHKVENIVVGFKTILDAIP